MAGSYNLRKRKPDSYDGVKIQRPFVTRSKVKKIRDAAPHQQKNRHQTPSRQAVLHAILLEGDYLDTKDRRSESIQWLYRVGGPTRENTPEPEHFPAISREDIHYVMKGEMFTLSPAPKVTPKKGAKKAVPKKEKEAAEVEKMKMKHLNDPKKAISYRDSGLCYVDIAKLLTTSAAWSSLSPAQQVELTNMMPKGRYSTPPTAISQSEAAKSDARLFSEELREGKSTATWQKEGHVAMLKRADGDFDDFKTKQAEERFLQ